MESRYATGGALLSLLNQASERTELPSQFAIDWVISACNCVKMAKNPKSWERAVQSV
jgi:hypothetical protein